MVNQAAHNQEVSRFFKITIRKAWLITAAIIVFYCLVSLAAYWPIYPGDRSKLPGCVCGDTVQSVWFLRWIPYAIAHGQNPFFTSAINLPFGVNLAQNTSMPLLALIVSPLTVAYSPIASFTLLAWLAYPASATTMYVVCYKLTRSRLAAFTAGLLYGFSPYMIGQGQGHIMLTFVPIPPLMMYVCWHLYIRRTGNPYAIGTLLAVLVIAQYLIDPEIIAITTIALLSTLAYLVLCETKLITKNTIKYITKGLVTTLLIAAVILAYPIWFMISGPEHFTGPNFAPGNPYRSDAVGLVIPTLNEQVIPPLFHRYVVSTEAESYGESGDYVGLPLLLLIIYSAIKFRKERWILILCISSFACWILSLGPRLVVGTHKTSIILPFAVFTKLPLLQDILPSRLSLAEWLLISLAISLIISQTQKELSIIKKWRTLLHKYNPKWLTISLIILTSVITLFPHWPNPAVKIDEPALFSSRRLAAGVTGNTLTYPLAIFPDDEAMLWQAQSNIQFKLVGAYIQNPNMLSTESEYPRLLVPASVEEWLSYEQNGTSSPWLPLSSVSSTDLHAFLIRYRIDTVIISTQSPHSNIVIAAFRTTLGTSFNHTTGTVLWTHIQIELRK
jgi:hypothetical protein